MNQYEFEQQLKRHIKQSGRTQASVARALGYSRDTFNKWVRGINRIPSEVLLACCQHLDLNHEKTTTLFELAGYTLPAQPASLETPAPNGPPMQRPMRPEHFTGRQTMLTDLLAELHPGRIITICGPGGVGKTALATEAVWQLPPERFPDGLIYHSFYSQPQVELALEYIGRAFGEEPRPTPRSAAQRALAGRQVLLFLDGAEEADNLPLLLDVAGDCGLLITSRRRRDAAATRYDLSSLPEAEAVALLKAWGRAQVTDETVARRICEQVGGLPLAVRLVGRYLEETAETDVEYLDWLVDRPMRALDHGDHQLESVRLLLERSVAQVSASAQQMLAVIGILAVAPLNRDVFVNALALSEADVRRALGELVGYGLLQRRSTGYEVSHALIHTYARRRLVAVIDQEQTIERLTDHYLIMLENSPADYDSLDSARPHFLRVLQACINQEAWSIAHMLANALSRYLELRGQLTVWRTVLGLNLQATRALDSAWQETELLGQLANVHRDLGEVQQAIAYHQQAINLARTIGHQEAEALNVGNLGLAYRALGQFHEAQQYHEQALDMARQLGHRKEEGIWLGNLATVYYILGDVDRSIAVAEEALQIAQEVGHRRNESAVLGNLGLAYHSRHEFDRATDYYQQALAIEREIGHRRGEAAVLGNLGLIQQDLEQAIGYHQQALAIARDLGYRRDELAILGNLGLTYRDLGQMTSAIEHYQQALAIAREIGDQLGEGINLHNLGEMYLDLADMPQATTHLEAALTVFEAIQSPHAENTRKMLARCTATRRK